MSIPEIKLDDSEVNDAVGEWLSKRGITVPVESVDRNYTGGGKWRVTLKEPEETPAKVEEKQPVEENKE